MLAPSLSKVNNSALRGYCPVSWLPLWPPSPTVRDGTYCGIFLSADVGDTSPHAMAERIVARRWLAEMAARPATPSPIERGLAAWNVENTPVLLALFTGQRKSRKGYWSTRRWFAIEAEKVMVPYLARIAVDAFDRRHGGTP